MREWFLKAPRWVVQVGTGVVYALLTTLTALLRGEDAGTAVIGGVIGGLLFGILFGWFAHRMNQRWLAATGGRGPSRAARRATWRGPAPVDPEERRQALALVDLQLRQGRWVRPLLLVLGGGLAVLFVVAPILSSPPPWFALVGALVCLGLGEGSYRLARRRRAVLTGSADDGVAH